MTYKGYIGTVECSEEDECLFGCIAGIRDIISYEEKSGGNPASLRGCR